MRNKRYFLRITPPSAGDVSSKDSPETWETESMKLRELRYRLENIDQLPLFNENLILVPDQNKNSHVKYDWGKRTTPRKIVEYANLLFFGGEPDTGYTIEVIEDPPNAILIARSFENEFDYVFIESEDFEISIEKQFYYSPFYNYPSFGWKAVEIDEDGYAGGLLEVWDTWLSKVRKLVVEHFEGAKVANGIIVSSLAFWHQDDYEIVFDCWLKRTK